MNMVRLILEDVHIRQDNIADKGLILRDTVGEDLCHLHGVDALLLFNIKEGLLCDVHHHDVSIHHLTADQ